MISNWHRHHFLFFKMVTAQIQNVLREETRLYACLYVFNSDHCRLSRSLSLKKRRRLITTNKTNSAFSGSPLPTVRTNSCVYCVDPGNHVSPEGACASPHAACVAALRHHCPKLPVSTYATSRAMSSMVCRCDGLKNLHVFIYKKY